MASRLLPVALLLSVFSAVAACGATLTQDQCVDTTVAGLTRQQLEAQYGAPSFACFREVAHQLGCNDLYGLNGMLNPDNPGPCCNVGFYSTDPGAMAVFASWQNNCAMIP